MKTIETLDQVRKRHIREVLSHAHGDINQASRILGITPSDLQQLIQKHGIQNQETEDENQATNREE